MIRYNLVNQTVIVVFLLGLLARKTAEDELISASIDNNFSNLTANNFESRFSSRANALRSLFSEMGENDITDLLNYTAQHNFNTGLQEEAKHSIILTHRNQHWIEQVTRKLAPIFSIISLWNEKCWTANFDQGTCYSRKECINKGGIPNGYCAGGFGVCCLFSYSCETASIHNRTYFMNPEFPNPSNEFGTCKHTISKLAGICQVRLDFEIFELERPESTGLCVQDMFHIEGIDFHLPSLCGDLTGHHAYLPVGFDSEIKMMMVFSPGYFLRRWKIRITRMGCNSAMLAPGGCMQYHHEIVGRITSFNYVDGAESNMNKLNYGVCVRKEKGFCAIQWSVCGSKGKKRKRRATVERAEEEQMKYPAVILNANQLRVPKKLWETGYDSQTEQERICRERARNATNYSNSSVPIHVACPPLKFQTNYQKSNVVVDSSWKPFIPNTNYYNPYTSQPQNSNIYNQQNSQRVGTPLIQSTMDYMNYNRTGVYGGSGSVSTLEPVASHTFEQNKPVYIKVIRRKKKPQSVQGQENFRNKTTTYQVPLSVNHAYGSSLSVPISSAHTFSPASYVYPNAGIKLNYSDYITEKKPSTLLESTTLKPKEQKKPFKPLGIKGTTSFGNKIGIKDNPQSTGSGVIGTVVNKLSVQSKPISNLIGGTGKIPLLSKPSGSFVGDKGIFGKVPVFQKPLSSFVGDKGNLGKVPLAQKLPSAFLGDKGIIGNVPVLPKPPVAGLIGGLGSRIKEKAKPGPALSIPGKIKETPKLPIKGSDFAKPSKIKEKPKLPGNWLLKPGKIKEKPKLPLKGSGFGLFGRPKVKPKLKPKYPFNLKRKKNNAGNCKPKLIVIPVPIPLPIPIPIPIVPVVVVPFPFGAGGGGGGGGAHGDHNDHVYSVTEPYLIRIVTDKKREEGLSSFCMDWEQISCELWHHHPMYMKHQKKEHDDDSSQEYDDDSETYTPEFYHNEDTSDEQFTNGDDGYPFEVMEY